MPDFIKRPPRIRPELPQDEIIIPPPSVVEDEGGLPWGQLLLPMITILGYVLASAAGRGRSLALMIPMALSMVASTAMALWEFYQSYRATRAKRRAYAQFLADMRKDMLDAHDAQRHFYHYTYPAPAAVLAIAERRAGSRFGQRLWERRTGDEDFCAVRLGIGTLPSTVTYHITAAENLEDAQMQEARRLAADSRFVTEVPITIPLRPARQKTTNGDAGSVEHIIPARHAIGVCGPLHPGAAPAAQRDYVYGFVRAMLVHLMAFHAPNDVRLYVAGSPDAAPAWKWASAFLPHSSGLCFQAEDLSTFWKRVRNELERRRLRLSDKDSADVTLPFLLVVVDMLMPDVAQTTLKDIESEMAVSILLNEGPRLGAAVLFLMPDPGAIPGACETIIEVDAQMGVFRYAETGVNSVRYVGAADWVSAEQADRFARELAQWKVYTTSGASLASSITLLEMFGQETIDALNILSDWQASRRPESAEWLHGPIGLMIGNEVRELVFAADADGVHGMIAGTTGSGKSELLLTLIVGLAMRYDPSVINFVLVDYKGGSAFDPFKTLPHQVDIVTNLQGMAGIRTFEAIGAELNRRSGMIAKYNVKHIVDYRRKGYHLAHEPFPFLFVIIDEFAEMVKERPEFKFQLERIARLGRALGVTLILATQRPTGVVTDQMRANMKFRICLRVETMDDSRELLRRSDAAYLPPNIPGRAYIQVGNDNLDLIQVARAGGPYAGPEAQIEKDVIWLNRPRKREAQERSDGELPVLSDLLVEMMRNFAEQNRDVLPQRKPWPDPLPAALALDDPLETDYIHPGHLAALAAGGGEDRVCLSQPLAEWWAGKTTWAPVDWETRAVRAAVGLIDNPTRAEQLVLTVNLARGHTVVFSGSGWGKTTFLRSLMMSLAASHAPDALHIYALDFGGRGLDVLEALPHVGAIINPAEEERVQRLLRWLNNALEYRKVRLSQARADSLPAYNLKQPADALPAILVAIDNFAEFKESYEYLIPALISLVREGRAYGIHFVATADQSSALPGKLFSLFPERLALKLANRDEYTNIIGRGVPGVDDVPGRGFVMVGRTPLEFQTAQPVRVGQAEAAAGLDENRKLAELVQTMSAAWSGARPEPIDTLPASVALQSLLPAQLGGGALPLAIPLGINDRDLKPAAFDLQSQGPHFVVVGPPLSGKTTALRAWALALAHHYTPAQAALVFIDFQGRLIRCGSARTLADLPHVLAVVAEIDELMELIDKLEFEYQAAHPRPEIFVVADNFDDFDDAVPSAREYRDVYKRLGDLARKSGPEGLHFILGGSLSIFRGSNELLKRVWASRYGLGLESVDAAATLGGKAPRRLSDTEFPPGRGYVVKSGRTQLMQVATPDGQGDIEQNAAAIDGWIDAICAQYPQRACWYQDAGDADETAAGEETP
ncbi:MAG: hypothetical protein JXB47_05400 [Anaerolineae bacterium]|nr:hypothetical protein [Anaerolineae bacterium]